MPDAAPPTSRVPPFIRARMGRSVSPDIAAAPRLLEATFGAGEAPVTTATVRGTIDIQSAQTHYSPGFALLMPIRESVTVACRPASGRVSRLVFASDTGPWTATLEEGTTLAADAPPWHRLMHDLMYGEEIGAVRHPETAAVYDLAVVSTIPGAAQDCYFSALVLATLRAIGVADVPPPSGGLDQMDHPLLPKMRDAVESATDRPTSIASLIASYAAGMNPSSASTPSSPDLAESVVLVDTGTYEFLPVETRARHDLDWVIIDPGTPAPRPATWHTERRAEADEALAILRDKGFRDLRSFRNVEHRDLEEALRGLPEALRPITQHLVTENRRVQKHVAAMRRGDWQMIGALLLMSHASLRDRLGATPTSANQIVNAVEDLSLQGMYGACMTVRDGLVLVVGRKGALGTPLEAIRSVTPGLSSDLHLLRP